MPSFSSSAWLSSAGTVYLLRASDGILYSASVSLSLSPPLAQDHHHHRHTYPPSPSRRRNGTRPPGQTPCNHDLCGLAGRAIELTEPSRASKLVFFPDRALRAFALTPPPNHDASSSRPPKSPKLQAPASRFIHPTAGQRIATRPNEPPATVDPASNALQLFGQPYDDCCPLGASTALFAEHGQRHMRLLRFSLFAPRYIQR